MGIRFARRLLTAAFGAAALLIAAAAPAQLLTGSAQALPGTMPSQSIVGMAIALSDNGNVALVGAPFTNGGQGAAYVYTKTGSTWSAPVALTLPTFVSSTPDFGRSVALSSDGTVALVGAPFENSSAGAVYAYTLSGGSWSGPTALSVSGLSNLGEFGYSVAMSIDTNGNPQALVGAPTSGAFKGEAYLYTDTSGTWGSPIALSLTGVSANSLLGYSVALSGATALVGAPSADPTSTGNAYIYQQTSGVWSAPIALDTTGVSAGDGFGKAVAVGWEALVGAPDTAGGDGAVYAYAIGSNFISGPYALDMTGVPSGAHFGASLAANNEAVVGAPTANGSAGEAYFFSLGPPNVGPAALDTTGVESGAQMGYAVAIDTSETAAVTATGAAPGYVYGPRVTMDVSVSATAASVPAGQDATFTIKVGNPDQQDTASNVTLTDVLPAGTGFVLAYSPDGPCNFSQSTHAVTCSLGTMEPNWEWAASQVGSGVTITVGHPPIPEFQDEIEVVVQTPAVGGTVVNTVSLSADQQLGGTTTAHAKVTAQASGSSGGSTSGGNSSGGGTGGSAMTSSSGGGAFEILLSVLLLGVLGLRSWKR